MDFGLEIFGESIVLRTNEPEVVEILAHYLGIPNVQPLMHVGPSVRKWAVTAESPLVSDCYNENLSSLLLSAVHELAAVLNDRFLFIHGCAFSADDRVIIFCGPSGSGKTTLAMVADALGYPVLGEDIVVLDWSTSKVYPLPVPFRPRPFTRSMVKRLYGFKNGSDQQKLPFRPRPGKKEMPLSRIFISNFAEHTSIEAVFESTFGRSALNPAHLICQIRQGLDRCRLFRCPPVRIAPSIGKERIGELFQKWLTSEGMHCPKEIFGARS